MTMAVRCAPPHIHTGCCAGILAGARAGEGDMRGVGFSTSPKGCQPGARYLGFNPRSKAMLMLSKDDNEY